MDAPYWPALLLAAAVPALWVLEQRISAPFAKVAAKALCSALFVTAAFLSAFAAREGWRGWHGLFLLAFLLSMAGDVLLALPAKRALPMGLGAFFAAQCAFAEAFAARWGVSPWDLAAFAAYCGAALLLMRKAPGMQFGNLGLAAALYAAALSAMAAKALSGLWLSGWRAWPAAAGGLLFWLSDAALLFLVFGGRKAAWIRALNLGLYYAGQGLLALSLY